MSVTKSSIQTAIDSAIDGATTNSGVLSNSEQADVLNAVVDAINYHCYTINPDIKPTPSIKIR